MSLRNREAFSTSKITSITITFNAKSNVTANVYLILWISLVIQARNYAVALAGSGYFPGAVRIDNTTISTDKNDNYATSVLIVRLGRIFYFRGQ